MTFLKTGQYVLQAGTHSNTATEVDACQRLAIAPANSADRVSNDFHQMSAKIGQLNNLQICPAPV